MKFTSKRSIDNLKEGKQYHGTIYSIDLVELEKGSYYDVKIELDTGIVSIWCSDDVNPEHPMFDVFSYFIEDDADAEDFDENEIVGSEVDFTVKVITPKKSKKTRIFFEKVTLTEEDAENE